MDAAAVFPSALSACCTVGTRPARRSLVASAVMLVGMVVVATPLGTDVRAVLLVALALLASAPMALGAPRGTVHPMGLHRGLSAIVMAGALVLGMGHGADHTTGHLHATGWSSALLRAALLGYIALSAFVVVQGVREARVTRIRGHRPARVTSTVVGLVEVVAMTVAVLAMTNM